jgi:hypothetical protein
MQIQSWEGAALSRAETVLQGTTHDTVRAEIGYGEKVSQRLWSKKVEEGIGKPLHAAFLITKSDECDLWPAQKHKRHPPNHISLRVDINLACSSVPPRWRLSSYVSMGSADFF